MTNRPCLSCGTPTPNTRCTDCNRNRERARPPRAHPAYQNKARWRNLSKRARKLQPFCSTCGATRNLQADHVISHDERPDLGYRIENIDVLCGRCNARKGNKPPTDEERARVLDRIAARKRRRTTA